MKKISLALFPVLALALFAAAWLWLFCRIPVPAGHMAIITRKTGHPLPPGQILAGPGEKGVQRDPLPEGRHFRDPVTHSWRIVPLVSIPVGKVGVVTAKVSAGSCRPARSWLRTRRVRACGKTCSVPAPTV